MSTPLIPCPFCGSAAALLKGLHMFVDVQVECTGCAATGPIFGANGGPNDQTDYAGQATTHWNTRAPTTKEPTP